LHDEKQNGQRISTCPGIRIEERFERENANASIRFNDDGDSNTICEND
jgi:hypothetical protein